MLVEGGGKTTGVGEAGRGRRLQDRCHDLQQQSDSRRAPGRDPSEISRLVCAANWR
jgi:hypothetical protein